MTEKCKNLGSANTQKCQKNQGPLSNKNGKSQKVALTEICQKSEASDHRKMPSVTKISKKLKVSTVCCNKNDKNPRTALIKVCPKKPKVHCHKKGKKFKICGQRNERKKSMVRGHRHMPKNKGQRSPKLPKNQRSTVTKNCQKVKGLW